MSSPGFTENPAFRPAFDRAVAMAITSKAVEVQRYARSNAVGISGHIPPNIDLTPASTVKGTSMVVSGASASTVTTSSATAVVRLRRSPDKRGFIGNFFEGGTVPRFTKGNGFFAVSAYRGVGPMRPFMQPALELAMRTPIPIERYLT